MEIRKSIDLLEKILAPFESTIGDDFSGYKNHCYRMLHFCIHLADSPSKEDEKKFIIAAAFHDIGIWLENTVDYIEPSIPPAISYLKEQGLDGWIDEVSTMISEHHKIRNYEGEFELAEVFRKGDLVDFSLGLVKFGVPSSSIKEVKESFPNEGFHKGLVKKASAWFLKHPLNPAPMMKW